MQASAELARRLMRVQRQRLAESQVVDRRARRTLHDDILPQLHTAMLALSGADDRLAVQDQLAEVHRQIADLLRSMPAGATPALERGGLLAALGRVIGDEMAGAFDAVRWQIDSQADEACRALPPMKAEVLFYAAREAVRNAARHGRGKEASRPLHLAVVARLVPDEGTGRQLQLVIEDDGVGLAGMESGGTVSAGQGLALHSTMMAVIGGSMAIESVPGAYARIVLLVDLPAG